MQLANTNAHVGYHNFLHESHCGRRILVNFSAETFINTMRPFLGALLEKFEICGTRMEKCKPGIVKKIAADQLPPKYGGTSSDWKPAAFTR